MNEPTRSPAQPKLPRRAAPFFRWSWQVGTVADIDIYLHGTFFFLLAFLAFGELVAGHSVPAMARAMLLVLAVFAAVVFHELGHALMARRFGIRTRDITLFPIGGIARLDKLPDKPGEQLLVGLAGPAVNVVIATLLFGLIRLFGLSAGIADFRDGSGPFLTELMWINVSLAVFNLLPGYPMDGGRVLRALLAMRMAPERATQTAARIGQGAAVVFGFVGLWVSPFLILIAAFVWLGASAEHSLSTTKVALDGLSVRDGMITQFHTLSPTDLLSRAVDLTLATFQQDFPVIDNNRLVGVLTHADVLLGLAEGGKSSPVREGLRHGLETASPSEPLDGAMTRMTQGECRVLVVINKAEVVGLLTLASIGELLAMETAGGHRGSSARSPAIGDLRAEEAR